MCHATRLQIFFCCAQSPFNPSNRAASAILNYNPGCSLATTRCSSNNRNWSRKTGSAMHSISTNISGARNPARHSETWMFDRIVRRCVCPANVFNCLSLKSQSRLSFSTTPGLDTTPPQKKGPGAHHAQAAVPAPSSWLSWTSDLKWTAIETSKIFKPVVRLPATFVHTFFCSTDPRGTSSTEKKRISKISAGKSTSCLL